MSCRAKPGRGRRAPLIATLETAGPFRGQLVIRVGSQILAESFERSEFNNPYDCDRSDFVQRYKVIDRDEFAKNVLAALCIEGEDGSTPITRMLDEACEEATEDGSLGLAESEGWR